MNLFGILHAVNCSYSQRRGLSSCHYRISPSCRSNLHFAVFQRISERTDTVFKLSVCDTFNIAEFVGSKCSVVVKNDTSVSYGIAAEFRLLMSTQRNRPDAGNALRPDGFFWAAHCKAKSPETSLFQGFSLAQMERFELSHRLSQSTPLAGEPLEPLGYFSLTQNLKYLFSLYIITYKICKVKIFSPFF